MNDETINLITLLEKYGRVIIEKMNVEYPKDNCDEIRYYVQLAKQNNWSVAVKLRDTPLEALISLKQDVNKRLKAKITGIELENMEKDS